MGASAPTLTTPIAPEILAAIDRGATVLTPNQRAARSLHRAFQSAQRELGHTRWTPPAIFALDTWLKTLWQQLLVTGAADRILLNPTQQHALWRSLIAADREVSGLRSPDSLAELAARAWHLLHLYNGAAQLRDALHTTDTRAFERWALQFDRLCQRDRYITPAELPAALDVALASGDLDVPNSGTLLLDFDQHPPAIAALLTSIEQAGYAVENGQTRNPAVPHSSAPHADEWVHANLQPAPDPTTELHQAAHWASTLLTRNPHQTIAIVDPNLSTRRPEVTRIFAEHLPPETFELSLGLPLAQTAYAAAALDLLRWSLNPLPIDRITALLLSPHFAPAAEPAAEFDAYDLRQAKILRPELSLDDTIDLIRRSNLKPRLAQLHGRLRNLRKAAAATLHSGDETHLQWSAAFDSLLESASLNSRLDFLTFQQHRRWQSALDTLATLDFNGRLITAPEALQLLERIATQTIFAPESSGAPVQILGPLELGAQAFDALWFLSADDRTWPAKPALNPLLPRQLQRTLGIPGADPARDAAHARTLTTRILDSAAQVIFSYATHAEDAPQRPSPLIRHLPVSVPHPSAFSADEWVPQELEIHLDTTPLPPLPPTTLSGGATILALEAACPFRAFAERRLRSADLDAPEPGLDSKDRGNLVHRVMQGFWDQLKTQQALRDLPPHSRRTFLRECIGLALTRTERQIRTPWDEAYIDVQRTRLQQLLEPWLELELDRPAFTVLATEHEAKSVPIGPLTLDLRVDRIDQTPAGLLILDYKTGDVKLAAWSGDRPDAPQLPLYAVANATQMNPNDSVPHSSPLSGDEWVHQPLAGVAFAVVRAGNDLDLTGFADTQSVFGPPGKMPSPTLEAQLESWHRVLENLAQAFADGNTSVTPKAYPLTCRHCTQRILCRLDPTRLPEYSDDEDDFPASPEDFLHG